MSAVDCHYGEKYNEFLARLLGRCRHGRGSAVGLESCLLVGCVAERCEHLVGIAAESRTRAVDRLIVGDGERYTHGYKLAYLAALIDLDKCIAVIEALVAHDLLGRKHGTYRHTGL